MPNRRLGGLPVISHQHRARGLDPVLFLGVRRGAQGQNLDNGEQV